MAYHVMYYIQVKPGQEEQFVACWKSLCNDIKERYGINGSLLFRTEGKDHIAIAVAPSKAEWEKFWVTKEIALESLAQMKYCLAGPTQPVPLEIIDDDWIKIQEDDYV